MASKNTFRTVRSVSAIKPPPAGRTEHWDEDVKGLGLRVSTSGRKSWVLLYRVRGDKRLRRATLGTYPILSLADAREFARSDLRSAAKGEDPASLRKAERDAESFGDIAERYIARYAKKRKKSWFKDQQALNRDLLPRFKHRKAASITRREVINLLEEIADRGAPVGANRTLEIIRRIYNWAIEQEYVSTNPCQRIKKIGIEKRRDRILTDHEIRAVWDAFEKQRRVGNLFKLRLLTVQRPGEVAQMRWRDIDFDGSWWTIPSEHSKNSLPHRVPLSRPAIQTLKSIVEETSAPSEWVFPSPTGRGHIRNVWRALDQIRSCSEVDFRPHDLRRTGASRMTGDLGISRLVVARILNHAETGVTATYDRHSYDREKRQALDTWGQRLLDILSGEKADANVISLLTSTI